MVILSPPTKPKMAKISRSLTLLSFLLLVLHLTALHAHTTEDPELQLCKKQCGLQTQFDEWQKQVCQQQCEEYAEQKAEREKEAAGQEEHKRQLEHCKHQCRSSQLSTSEQEECEQQCREHHKERRDGERGEGPEERLEHCRHQCQSTEKGRHEQQQCRRECEEQYQGEREGQGQGEFKVVM